LLSAVSTRPSGIASSKVALELLPQATFAFHEDRVGRSIEAVGGFAR
jgi:hypothetical protein